MRSSIVAGLIVCAGLARAEESAAGAGAAPRDPNAPPAPAPLTAIAHPFDPYQGMARDGRIPKVRLPADVPNPERWRYVPEGRLKPGNVLQRFMVSSFASPIVYYEEAIGAGGGISLTDIDFREQRRREFLGLFAARSTLGQEGYSVVWQRWLAHRELSGGGVLQEERTFLRGIGGYNRSLTRRFYGFGPDTPDTAETSYTDEVGFAEMLWQASLPRPGDDAVLALGAQWQHHNLYRGRVPRHPSTVDAFPALVADADSHDALWLTAGLRWDTRDSQHNPYRGWMTGLTLDAAPAQTHEEFGAIASWRSALLLPVPGIFHHGGVGEEENPPTDVIAVGGFVQAAMGELPFYDLPSLGGPNSLRAYIADRFTDRAAWHASAEYRAWVIPRGFAITDSIRVERLGVAPFYELGSVAHDLGDFGRSRVRQSYGVGLRAMLERTAVFRVDFGWAPDSFGFNVAYGMSF